MYATSAQPAPAVVPNHDPARDRTFVLLLGLHGLALMVVFPLGPQVARIWHPGITGFAALTAAFPLAAFIGGLLARRIPRLPATPRALALLAFVTTLPCALSVDYPSLLAARLVSGFATGIAFVAIHRVLPVAAGPLAARLTPRIVAFGLPCCLLAATFFNWRCVFLPLLAGHALLATRTFSPATPAPPRLAEAAPAALVATGALASASGAFLTVLSGFLVLNAGHTEFHIPAVLLLAALLGLAVPPALARLRTRLAPALVFAATLVTSAVSITALLVLRGPQPGALALAVIAVFIAANAARHLALAGLVLPSLAPETLPAHQTHTHLAHHLGSGLGALSAGMLITVSPAQTFTGMPALVAVTLTATTVALVTGLWSAVPRRVYQVGPLTTSTCS